ncbi:MAG TPA: GIY-YIG nuclease family protein [Ktedonobacterales bacterium]|nr:GIY-YIG nuclease family protein [Ktedonobacterales bacterium]
MDKATMNTGIYVMTCLETGNQYIGQSIDIAGRWSAHRTDLRGGRHRSQLWQDEWVAYGPDAFTWEVLEAVSDVRTLNAREQHYLNGMQPAYNLSQTNERNTAARDDPHAASPGPTERERYEAHRAADAWLWRRLFAPLPGEEE